MDSIRLATFNMITALLLVVPVGAHATLIEVLWSADVGGNVTIGTGTISGSLGVFDVQNVGDTFSLPQDGSLTATTSGFTSGFPNQIFPLDDPRTDLAFQFTSISPFSGILVETGPPQSPPIFTSTGVVPCLGRTECGPALSLDEAWAAAQSPDLQIATGSLVFTFVPEPNTAALLGLGLPRSISA